MDNDATSLSPIRAAVRAAPSYPFVPIDAPIKLDQNESPYDFPSRLKEEALGMMLSQAWNRYPNMHADALRAQIASLEGHDPLGVVVTPGSNVLIHALVQAAGVGQRVVTLAPAFSLYGLSGKLLANELCEVPLPWDFTLPVEALCVALKGRGPGVLYLAVPHAPTGTLPTLAELETVLAASDGWLVVLDEAYVQFAGRDHKTFLARDNVCILRTFSKAWGLAGLRLGYLLANVALAQNIQKLISPFNVSGPVMAALGVALKNPGYVAERVQETILERERVADALRQTTDWVVYPSAANFLLLRTPDAAAVYSALLAQGVLVRRQDSLPGLEGCLRVSMGTPAENDAFLEAALVAAKNVQNLPQQETA